LEKEVSFYRVLLIYLQLVIFCFTFKWQFGFTILNRNKYLES
jgi:hypothetical protein